jgi:hypothetical protein
MTLRKAFLLAALAFALLAPAFFAFSSRHREKTIHAILSPASWQHTVIPDDLSQAHAFLDNNCAACHTPVKGVLVQNCILCHADNQSLLQRQPTAFHANIQSCTPCHMEHRGRTERPTNMDHVALARIGFKELEREPQQARVDVSAIKRWLKETHATAHPNLRPEEAVLDCATCHATKDKHQAFFGTNCAECHGTNAWTIPEFQHPPPSSMDCAQCHQAPPSHYMEHFHMVSMKVARQEHADVSQCFLCHQTTSWNDIKGVGYYKHH